MRVLEDQMSLLRVEKETIEDDLAAVVYPLLTLPNEITSKIFVHYVDDLWRHKPQRLLSVCSAWRKVALSTCWLFNRVTSRHVDQLAAWLPLFGNLPLTLDFTSYYPSLSSEFRLLCQLLSDYSSRWQSLTLNTMGSGVMPVHLAGTFSSLTTLDCTPMSSSTERIPMLHAPRLVELRLDCTRLVDCCDMIEYLTIPALHNLTIHFTPYWNWGMMGPLVARSRCTIRHVELWMDMMDEATLVVDFFDELALSSVRELTICIPTKDMISTLFDALSDNDYLEFLPILEALKIGDVQFQIPLIHIVDMLSVRTQRVTNKDGTMANLKSFKLTFGSLPATTRSCMMNWARRWTKRWKNYATSNPKD
ncbi:hypothetical protein FB45DRAFT_1053352 [Roridomyces roridus]|uniref:F-box domain-containing protein n=1 Tax=Roridomyces roridus TaxID=1738132 RepID=A0AAD7CCI5_9AGAR|nr:hypothetical protein FB45DRAFT_1053352 [Roridomyces roridus]